MSQPFEEAMNAYHERELERKLVGQAYKFKHFLRHEIQEIRLSIDREKPNIEMALGRIRNIERFIDDN